MVKWVPSRLLDATRRSQNMNPRSPRLLVKTKLVPAGISFSLGPMRFKLEPLFPSRRVGLGDGFAPSSEWHVASTSEGTSEADAWDLCHQIVREGLGFSGAPAVEFAEPDTEQQW